MSRLREFLASLVALWRAPRYDLEMDEEIASHLDLATDDYLARGLDPKAARRAALLDFGAVELAREQHRESRGLPSVESWLRDLRLALRALRRDASVSVFAVVIVALGIGAATLVFSVTNTLLLQPLPFEDHDRLVWIANGTSRNLSSQTLQVDNVLDLRRGSQTFVDMAGFNAFYGVGDLQIDGAEGPQRITAVPLSENFLDLLGVEPLVGRGFTAQEVRDREPVLLLGHALWRSRYGGDRDVVGRGLRLNGEPATIIGVLPPTFDFERLLTPGRRADVFVPFALDEQHNRRGNTLAVIGRLAAGVSVETAQDELTLLAEEITALQIERRNSVRPRLVPLHGRISGATRPSLLLLSGAVALLLLLVCANLSNLLLARASGRRREMAVHVALGARRGRLIRRLLIESLLLSGAGAGLGVALAGMGVSSLARLEGTAIPLLHQVRLDATVLVFAVSSATIVGLLFGIAPALQASTLSPVVALRDGGRTSDRGGSRLRRLLVVCEVALASVLLMAVALFARSLNLALETDLGFDPEHLAAVRVDPPESRIPDEEHSAYYASLLEAVRSLPGVQSASLTDALPLGDNFGWRTWTSRPQEAEEDEDSAAALVRLVGSDYAETLGLRLLAGRFVEERDDRSALGADAAAAEGVVVVNEVLARRLWPSVGELSEVISRRLMSSQARFRVIGVVSEARYFDLERASGAEMYFALSQVPWASSVDLVMRTEGRPGLHLEEIRKTLSAVDPALPLDSFRTMESLIDQASFDRRAVTGLLAAFAGFGLLLAVLGVYGVIAYSVAQRRRELGVRMAFGATGRRLGWQVASQTLRPVASGIVLGLLLVLLLGRFVTSQLYGVEVLDPWALTIVIVALAVSALLAAWLPARRAAAFDVAEVLRADG